MRHIRMRMAVSVALASVALVVAACGSDNNDSSSSSSSGSSSGGHEQARSPCCCRRPRRRATRRRTGRCSTAKLKALCPNCKLIYSNADQDAAKQQQQAEAAHHQGREGARARPGRRRVGRGDRRTAPSSRTSRSSRYDRLITNADVDYYISFDNEQVGKLQGNALLKRSATRQRQARSSMINGAPTDNNAKLFKAGAHSVLDTSGVKIAKEYDTPDWSPDKAQTEMEQAITALGKDGFDGVYAANDGTAGGAIAAMKGAGIDPTTGPDDRPGRRARRRSSGSSPASST